MAKGRSGGTFRDLHTLFHLGTVGNLTDAQLLWRYANRDGEAAELAFAALVDRHGPMVYRVCRAALADEAEVDDAFQAVFLVLVRKARSLWVRDSIGPWLHAVALRVARGMRSTGQRRRRHERRTAQARPLAYELADRSDEAAIHEEIARLPNRFRAAVVACDLEGLTTDQAATRLGWPVGTVRSRLARGRQRLRDRLTRRGLAPAVGVPIGGLAAMRLPVSLKDSTLRMTTRVLSGAPMTAGDAPRAVVLSKGVLNIMTWTNMGLPAACLAACVAVAGTAILISRGEGRELAGLAEQEPNRPPEPKQAAAPADPQPQAKAVRELAEARADLARRGVEKAWAALTSPPGIGGMATQAHAAIHANDLVDWSVRWMEAEQDMADSEAAKVAAVQGHIDRLEEYLPGVREMSRGGGSAVSSRDVDLVEYALLDAKTRLLKVRSR